MIGEFYLFQKVDDTKEIGITISLSTYNRVLKAEIYDKNQQRCEVENDKKL